MEREYLEKIIEAKHLDELYFSILRLQLRKIVRTLTTNLESAGVDLYDWIEN